MPPRKTKQSAKSRTATTKINADVKVGDIKGEEEQRTAFPCTCCGKVYTVQKSNFSHSMSPLWKHNDGFVPVCKRCTDKYYEQLIDYFTGNEEKAMERIAQIFDWYYNDEIFGMTRKISMDRSRVGAYPSKMQLPQCKVKGTTYLDTIKDRASLVVSTYDDFEDMKEAGETNIRKTQIDRWGLGFEESEYKQLDAHYKTLSENIDSNDVVQDTLIKDLCVIKIQQSRARNNNDIDSFQKLTKLYQDTLKSANLKVKGIDNSAITDAEACWGNFVRDVENYTPAEIYKDRKLFADLDGLKEYMERFVTRPVKNFFLGTREMDPEFSIGVSDDDD